MWARSAPVCPGVRAPESLIPRQIGFSVTILAETQQAATGGGSAWFLPVMLLAMVLLLWLPMRRQKKAQAEMKTKQASMGPGTQVMTSFGLFGTLREMDRENNKAVLEIAPGRAAEQALTDQEGFGDRLHGLGLLPHRNGQGGQAHRAAVELAHQR